MRVRLTVAYDGAGFSGFAAQPGVRTVGGTLADVLGRVLRQPVTLTVAGRTDAGVHAWGQVVSFDVDPSALPGGEVDLAATQRSVNGALAPTVVVRDARVADPAFDARRSALARRYRYSVLNRETPDPFLRGTTWHVPAPLDLDILRLACDPLIGERDFSSFCRVPRRATSPVSMVRRVIDARWVDLGDGLLRFDVEASSFCHQMVRALTGTMVAMGAGRKKPGEMATVMRARSRAAAPDLAPAHGLCLWEVVYP